MPHERQRAIPGADQRKAGESLPRYTGSSILNRPVSPAGADLVLFLRRAAGNRAATRLLQRFPASRHLPDATAWNRIWNLRIKGPALEDRFGGVEPKQAS
jgi:hypothetical protein